MKLSIRFCRLCLLWGGALVLLLTAVVPAYAHTRVELEDYVVYCL